MLCSEIVSVDSFRCQTDLLVRSPVIFVVLCFKLFFASTTSFELKININDSVWCSIMFVVLEIGHLPLVIAARVAALDGRDKKITGCGSTSAGTA